MKRQGLIHSCINCITWVVCISWEPILLQIIQFFNRLRITSSFPFIPECGFFPRSTQLGYFADSSDISSNYQKKTFTNNVDLVLLFFHKNKFDINNINIYFTRKFKCGGESTDVHHKIIPAHHNRPPP